MIFDWPQVSPPNQTNQKNNSAETSDSKRDKPNGVKEGIVEVSLPQAWRVRRIRGSERKKDRNEDGLEERRALYPQTRCVGGINDL